jgi:GH35 family endo-1,4-beta-xylanase
MKILGCCFWGVCAGWFAVTDAAGADGNDSISAPVDEWRAESAARIEKHRKNDVRIVVTRAGKPVQGAKVAVVMKRHEFLFGCNIFKWNACSSPAENEAYSRQFAELFNFATLPFYWQSYEPEKDNTAKAQARNEQIAAWCAGKGIRTKGHPLAWNYHDPAWTKDVDDAELFRRQINRVTDCVQRFHGSIDVWDVINEVAKWDRDECRKQSPRLTHIMETKGAVEYVKTCFAAARAGAAKKDRPQPLLLINDYDTGDACVTLLSKLNDDSGRPIFDATGIQSHMHGGVWNNANINAICDRFAQFGKPLHFTELTILSSREKFTWEKRNTGVTNPADEAWQRDQVVRIYTMLFSHPSVEAITWWDFTDQGAWMNCPAGLLREDMSPKPAYTALKNLITREWTTNLSLTTDDTGTIRLRAFRGTYDFVVTPPADDSDKQPVPISFEGAVTCDRIISLDMD